MANIKSAKKKAKQDIKRTKINLNRKTSVKSAIKKVVEALKSGQDLAKTKELLKEAESKLARAKSKGVIHKRTASRKVSRLAKKVAQTATAK